MVICANDPENESYIEASDNTSESGSVYDFAEPHYIQYNSTDGIITVATVCMECYNKIELTNRTVAFHDQPL